MPQHIARVEVMDGGDWATRMSVTRRDVGTGMTDVEVDALSAAIDLAGLREYWDAVIDRTLAVVDTLAGEELDTVVPADRVRRVANEEGGVAKGAAWLTEFWAKGRRRAWGARTDAVPARIRSLLRGTGCPRYVGAPEPLIASF